MLYLTGFAALPEQGKQGSTWTGPADLSALSMAQRAATVSCYLKNSPSLCWESCGPDNLSTKPRTEQPQVPPDMRGAQCLPPCRRSASISVSSRLNMTRTPAKAKSRWSFQNLLLLWALQWQREGVVQFWHYFIKQEKKGIFFFSPSKQIKRQVLREGQQLNASNWQSHREVFG